MGSFYATRCKTDCLQTLYKFCKNWISVPNIVHQLTLSSPVNIGLENTQPQLFPKCYSLISMRRSASDGERATERSLWRQSSMTSFVSKPFVATWTCLRRPFLTVCGNMNPEILSAIVCTPKGTYLPHNACFELFCAKIHARVTSVGESWEKIMTKIKTRGLIFHVFRQALPYGRLAQILGYVFAS